MADALKAFAISTVATAPSPAASGTSLVVAAGHGARFPATPFNATVCPAAATPDPTNAEIVRVTNISTDTLTIEREQEGTSARTIGTGDLIFQGVTPKMIEDPRAPANHDHASNKLAQSNTHESPDTDTAPTALHHTLGTGANQAAAGNHNHSGVYEPVQTAASQAEMEAGTETALRSMTPQRVAQAIAALAGGGGGSQSINDLRLTTESGVPASTTDRTAQSTIYLTPYIGNKIALYSGSSWDVLSSAEVSLVLSGLTSGKNYDVFAYNNSGTLTLELSAAWTDDTTRADALARQDGVLVKSGTATRRYVGTIRTTGVATTEDSATKRFVWNQYNRVPRTLFKAESTSSWTYSTATIRQARADAANQVELVVGDSDAMLNLVVSCMGATSAAGTYMSIGIGEDSTTSHAAETMFNEIGGIANVLTPVVATLIKMPAVGYHYYAWLERGHGSATQTFFATGAGLRRGGLTGTIR